MIETALPTTDFAENAGMTVSRVSAVLWCFARNIYRKGEQRKMIENEMTVSVPLEVVKASEIEPKEVKWLRTANDKITSMDEYWADDGNPPQWRIDKHIGTPII